MNKRKKICILITGGTIGMITHNSKSYVPDSPLDYKKLFPSLSDLAELDYHTLFYSDSSAIEMKEWCLMARAIEKRQKHYDGFVVCHGTDTMAYSASALGYAYSGGLTQPIVFTGSQCTPDLPNSDAEMNLKNAILLANSNLAEVAIVFNNKAWRACRALKVSNQQDAAFITPFTPPLAEMRSEWVFHKEAKTGISRQTNKPLICFSDKLCLFHAVPSHNSLNLITQAHDNSWQLALLIGIGNANLPPNFLSFVQKAIERGKQIVISSPISDSSPISYPPFRKALEAGALYAQGYSLAGLWTKLCWLMGQCEERNLNNQERWDFFKKSLSQSYTGEIET